MSDPTSGRVLTDRAGGACAPEPLCVSAEGAGIAQPQSGPSLMSNITITPEDRQCAVDIGSAEGWHWSDERVLAGHYDDDASLVLIARHAEAARLSGHQQGVAEERGSNDRRIRQLEAALRVSRGWVITCSESAQARRDLRTIDEALAIRTPNKGEAAPNTTSEG